MATAFSAAVSMPRVFGYRGFVGAGYQMSGSKLTTLVVDAFVICSVYATEDFCVGFSSKKKCFHDPFSIDGGGPDLVL
jgi:hypothetical protein